MNKLQRDQRPEREAEEPPAPDAVVGTREHVCAVVSSLQSAAPYGHTEARRAALRTSVTAYARGLRVDGEPPQRMVVLVKEAVREAALPELAASELRELTAHAVRWGIEAYYAA